MSYDEAIRRHGNDKPDMRLPAMVDARSAAGRVRRVRAQAVRKEFPATGFASRAGDISGTERRTIDLRRVSARRDRRLYS